MTTGAFVVIDGIDGAGKATQSKLLIERLTKEGISAEKIDFPRYGTPVFGELLGECLAGKHGDFLHLDPKIASTLYALDRFEASDELREWLAAGKVVVADRFSSSNQIHQGGKVVDEARRATFLAWIDRMEHDVEAKNKALADGEKDTVEKDRMYLERSFESAEQLAKGADWVTVECTEGGAMRAPEAIHEDVYMAVRKLLV